ncbi:MAG: Nif3-like dinuclear metal center hexameric protein [Actinomycetes bacterium]
MPVKLSQVIYEANHLWPENLAEEWDAPGLVCGNPSQEISNVLLSVDVTQGVLSEAIERNCQLILAHHPLLLRGVTSIAVDKPKGALLTEATRGGVAVFAAHTNADVVEDGVSDTLAKSLSLNEIRPLVSTGKSEVGHGRIGKLSTPIRLGDLALAIGRLLPPTAGGVKVSGDFEKLVETVALCGGAGDSFIDNAKEAGADVYITSDLRHHPVQEARESNPDFSLIDISHWASESLWLEVAAKQLSTRLTNVQFFVSDVRTDAWDFTVTQ